MPRNDFAIEATTNVPIGPSTSKKPSYLIVFQDEYEEIKKFVTTDKPDILNNIIAARGLFIEPSSDITELQKCYSDLLSSNKDNIEEIWVPVFRIYLVKNLVFKTKS